MAGTQPPARKGATSAWNRLKTPATDPLERYGLPSKGETRLNDFRAQETYYNKIVERYMKFCSSAGEGEELDKRFASLYVSGDAQTSDGAKLASQTPRGGLAASKHAATQPIGTSLVPPGESVTDSTAELQRILSALRKLRESITATHRCDTFAQRCYIFTIRACILTKSWEAYHPALLYLLSTIHQHAPLGPSELREFVQYRVLDEACRVGDLAEAQRLRVLWNKRAGEKLVGAMVESVLTSLVHDNWHRFWRLRRAVDGYQRALMSWAEERMRLHSLKCLGRSYFTAERAYIERCTGLEWNGLLKLGVAWELQDDGKVVVIKRVKVRPQPNAQETGYMGGA